MVLKLANLVADLKENEALRVVMQRLEAGDDPLNVLNDAREGMQIVGDRFASSEYFLPELVYSGEILKALSELIKQKLPKTTSTKLIGKIVFGTVAGDIHNIGKDIVICVLEASGFEVYDMGVDCPPQRFIEKLLETEAEVLGLSGLCTLAFDSMKETVEAVRAVGLRDKVKIMIGGGVIDENVRKYAGADAYGRDAMVAVSMAQKWLEGKRK